MNKIIVLVLLTVLPLLGFYLGLNYKASLTTSKNSTAKHCDSNFCILDGSILYTNSIGEMVSLEIPDRDKVKYRRGAYLNAQISPNNQFLYLDAEKDMSIWSEIYDLKSKQLHVAPISGLGMWLTDGRILVIGNCGVGYTNCGEIHISKKSSTPWETELIYTYDHNDDHQADNLDQSQ